MSCELSRLEPHFRCILSLQQNFEESDDEEDEIEEAAEKIYEKIQGNFAHTFDDVKWSRWPCIRSDDKINSAQYEAKMAPDLNHRFLLA